MNQRLSFIVLLVLSLFLIRVAFIPQIHGPYILNDEVVYGYEDDISINSILNFSIYSAVPHFFGYPGAIWFNCLLASLCSIPIFYLIRKFQSERNSAILAVIVSLFAPLWLYSYTNMTEISLDFVILNSAFLAEYFFTFKPTWGSFYDNIILAVPCAIAVMIKPTGIALPLSKIKYGFYIGLAGGAVMCITHFGGMPFAVENTILVSLRSITYIFFATLGFIVFPLSRYLKGKADAYDYYALSFLASSLALQFAFFTRLPHDLFYGRYWDAGILLVLSTTLFKQFEKDRTFYILLFGLFILASIYPTLHPTDLGKLMDAGVMPFVETLQRLATRV